MMKKALIIGGVAGGATAAARLRRLDEKMEITLLEKGEEISIANCGLPYYIGEEIPHRSSLLLQTPESFRRRYNVDVRISSEAKSIDRSAKTVIVENCKSGKTYKEPYDMLLLSPGASPIRPQFEGASLNGVFSVSCIADADRVKLYMSKRKPKSAAIIGGGAIGIEMAENLRRLGLSVLIIEQGSQILPSLDFEMALEAANRIMQRGVKISLSNGVRKIQMEGGSFKISLEEGHASAEMVVLATGVRPNSALAKDAGLELDENGGIAVSPNMRTSDECIYAVGDAASVANFVTEEKSLNALAGAANKQARIAADNMAGILSTYRGAQGTMVLKAFDATVAMTGISEKTATKLGLSFDKAYLWLAQHASYYPGAQPMSIKAVFEKSTGKLFGAQIVGGNGVDKRMDVLATAIRSKMCASELAELELCYAPPYGNAKDPVNMIGFAIENQITGKVKTFHWHDAAQLPRDGSATFVDVRMPQEYASGHIEGFANIPLDMLRARIGEIPKSKPVYVNCQIGQRSYLACRILAQNGYDAYSLSGGFRLYSTIFGKGSRQTADRR
ncbi:MAG: FAD-dependent oxidoreductase [Eubacteriaceae bacterium]|jgi:NADPH-dependent 2,4-dienoyl-CoA reductase/sulfur reductase-like enzyme/rhodanese-related sulfurtransferase|nr:FAD-dependent oxidoreductase [Eubacteriaceae bacterium]